MWGQMKISDILYKNNIFYVYVYMYVYIYICPSLYDKRLG